MLEEYEHRRIRACKSYERFKEVTLKQLDFVQSLEFEKLSPDEKFFQQIFIYDTCTVIFVV